jgi:hypothetical protein
MGCGPITEDTKKILDKLWQDDDQTKTEVDSVQVDYLVSRQDTFGGAKVLDDGCGNTWINQCESCKKIGTLEIVRPGKVQCSNCG